MFNKILIANRGEIACRVIDTCRRLGVATVAVYSDADANARHVREADEARRLGPAQASESYLDVDKVLAAARETRVEAIHPGYGFLSENDVFAEACEAAGIVFIGPPAESIRAMGSKSAAKTLMGEAGVPLVPGYNGEDQSDERLQQEADRIGYPLMIKASAGGGGKGMRVVRSSADFTAALASCQRESQASFGDDFMLLEKYLDTARHIEIQVFADQHGNVVHLFERDCSSQRRQQKVIEEAPAPTVDDEQRQAMGQSACDAARAVNYVGAGTVEFIADDAGHYYFMEMNTRLQVEHPVTEMITGQDLVAWQLQVAFGQPLPCRQKDLTLSGHAIETRIYAEAPDNGFLPSVGHLQHLVAPAAGPAVRWETGVEAGDDISPHYDPMIAKLVVHAADREMAINRMRQALAQVQIIGVSHNVDFLTRLISHSAFAQARVDTGFIERQFDDLTAADEPPPATMARIAALVELCHEQQRARTDATPWAQADGWRLNGHHVRHLVFRAGEHELAVEAEIAPEAWQLDGQTAGLQALGNGRFRIRLGEQQMTVSVIEQAGRFHVFAGGAHHVLDYRDPIAEAFQSNEIEGELTAPMPGRIVAVSQTPGADVNKGDPLIIMEAMKMEMTIDAPSAGTVVDYYCAVDDQISGGDELVKFEPAE